MAGLMPVSEALQALLADCDPRPDRETVPLASALGRTLADTIVASNSVPPANNSAMDGYAVRVAEISEQILPISQRIQAGQLAEPLATGTVARIFTGAPVPEGADAVLMQEDVELLDDGIRPLCSVTPGQHIRLAGEDIKAGQQAIDAGQRLTPQALGVLASLGIAELPVFQKLKVGVLSTGDELQEPGANLQPGKIFNSNRFLLQALLQALGMECLDRGIVRDDPQHTRDVLQALAEEADVIVTTGGVSVGEADYVKDAVSELGELKLWKLAIKPGKPLAYGRVGRTPFFGLPGNPASSFVTFLILARPYLLTMQGRPVRPQAAALKITADFEWLRPGTREEYLRGRLKRNESTTCVELYAQQGSGVLRSTLWADCLVRIPVGATINRGDEVDVLLLQEMLY